MTHCRSATFAFRLTWMSPSATLTTVLSRKVRKSSVHRVARARAWPPRGTMPFPGPPWGRSPESASARLVTGLVLLAHGHRSAGVLEFEQLTEAHVSDLPHAVLVD